MSTWAIVPQLLATFSLLSLLSIGGANATLPEIHRQIVDQLHWMDNATFASLVAVGQSTPGPNVLIVSLIGWQMAGLVGFLVATAAIVTPSCLLAFCVGRAVERLSGRAWLQGSKRALAPIAVGLMLASGIIMAQASYRGAPTLVIVLTTTALVALTRVSPLWGLGGGAIFGILARHLAL